MNQETKKIQDNIMSMMQKVDDGEMTALDAVIGMRKLKFDLTDAIKMIQGFENEFMEQINAEVDNWGGAYKGYQFQVRSGGKTWNFKNIPEWQEAESRKKEIEDRYKTYWNAAQKGALMATEDGEEIVLPEINYRAASIIMTKDKANV